LRCGLGIFKIDSVNENIWRKINAPHKVLKLDKILNGVVEFARIFKGRINTETMLIQGFNDNQDEIEKVAGFLAGIKGVKSYLSIPVRPPAREDLVQSGESVVNMAYQFFSEKSIGTECITGYEGNAFAFTGYVKEDIMSITSVHPMKKEAVNELLIKSGKTWEVIERLIKDEKLREVEYNGDIFYMRNLK